MKLTGKVLKPFNDSKDNFKEYTPKDDYKDADVFTAERERYEDLYRKGYVEKGKLVEDKKSFKFEENKEEK